MTGVECTRNLYSYARMHTAMLFNRAGQLAGQAKSSLISQAATRYFLCDVWGSRQVISHGPPIPSVCTECWTNLWVFSSYMFVLFCLNQLYTQSCMSFYSLNDQYSIIRELADLESGFILCPHFQGPCYQTTLLVRVRELFIPSESHRSVFTRNFCLILNTIL